MAVYTDVSDQELEAFIASYDIGALTSFKGIAEGVENTNYLVHTDTDPFILTLYEKRVRAEDLPYFLSLMEHLVEKGITCPLPVECSHAAGRRAASSAHWLTRSGSGAPGGSLEMAGATPTACDVDTTGELVGASGRGSAHPVRAAVATSARATARTVIRLAFGSIISPPRESYRGPPPHRVERPGVGHQAPEGEAVGKRHKPAS